LSILVQMTYEERILLVNTQNRVSDSRSVDELPDKLRVIKEKLDLLQHPYEIGPFGNELEQHSLRQNQAKIMLGLTPEEIKSRTSTKQFLYGVILILLGFVVALMWTMSPLSGGLFAAYVLFSVWSIYRLERRATPENKFIEKISTLNTWSYLDALIVSRKPDLVLVDKGFLGIHEYIPLQLIESGTTGVLDHGSIGKAA